MSRYLAVRLYSMGLTLVGLTVLVFLMLRLVPGTVVEQMIGADAVVSQAMVDQLKAFSGSTSRGTSSTRRGLAGSRTVTWARRGEPESPSSCSSSSGCR